MVAGCTSGSLRRRQALALEIQIREPREADVLWRLSRRALVAGQRATSGDPQAAGQRHRPDGGSKGREGGSRELFSEHCTRMVGALAGRKESAPCSSGETPMEADILPYLGARSIAAIEALELVAIDQGHRATRCAKRCQMHPGVPLCHCPRVFASPGAFKFEVATGTSRSYHHLFQCILVPLGSHAAINLSLLD